MGTILDIFKFSKKKSKIRIPDKARSVKYGVLITILFAAVFSNLSLLIFDPITIFTRSFTITILPVLDKLITTTERALINVPFLKEAIFGFDTWLRPAIFPAETVVFQYSLLTGLFFVGIILLNLVAERFWCRYICPLGAMLGIFSKFSLIKRSVKDNCKSCALCATDCPTDTIDAAKDFASDPSECTMCMRCLESCQKDALSFSPRFSVARFNDYDPNRRTFLNTFVVSILAVAVLSIDWLKKIPTNHRIRPPGVDVDNFTSNCIRCGLCMKVCPTHALQPDLTETGVEGIVTPILVPRLGFCQYSCNACGQICPVGAIPALSLEEKKVAIIGKAYIDHNRCIAWGDHKPCIVCEEMCPLPDKAITLDIGEFISPEGEPITLQLPVVNRDTCIGCGTCEFKCPVVGESAIRVFTA